MNFILKALFLILMFFQANYAVSAVNETQFSPPNNSEAYVIGKTNNGCIFGAKALPLQGNGYLLVHLERQRYYGHPVLIQTLQELAKQAQQQQLGILQIGDLGQNRGGALPFGHRSHQSGLDADIWFNLNPKSYANANKQRSNIKQPSMLNPNGKGLNAMWTNKHRKLLELAANMPEVDRIFVNPHIKQDLCTTVTGNRQWLQKIRPWYYHDEHFHVRLRCPKSSPECIKQAPISAGDGCNATLSWWFKKHPVTHSAKKKIKIPKACQI